MEVRRHGVVGTQAGHHHRLHGVLRTLRSLLCVELLSGDSSDLELVALWSQDGCSYSSRQLWESETPRPVCRGDAGDASGVGLRGAMARPDSGALASACPQHPQGRVPCPPRSASASASPGAVLDTAVHSVPAWPWRHQPRPTAPTGLGQTVVCVVTAGHVPGASGAHLFQCC